MLFACNFSFFGFLLADFLRFLFGSLLVMLMVSVVVPGEDEVSVPMLTLGDELSKRPGGGDGVREPREDSGDETALLGDCMLWCALVLLLDFVGDSQRDGVV